MCRNLLIIITIFIFNWSTGQSKNIVLDKYPFNKAKSIMLASFQNLEFVNDTLSKIKCVEIPKTNGKVNVEEFEQLVKLHKSKYEKLYNILFSKSIEENIVGKGNCSETGYAVLFFDAKGNVFEYLQFCYNCKTFSSSFNKDLLKNEDYAKLEQFKKLFDDNGISVIGYRGE
ncbi:hypothetical protein ACFFLS_07900 [Flavobacterium procerum]|uniref:Uncharacterized protein n=1 Tax=Flavobacterium procerum TaxID=1455569 RepID=A0ABV6BNE0_9FLAO